MAWQGETVGMVSPMCGKINRRLLLAYPKASQAVELGVALGDVFTPATGQALANFQRYVNEDDPAHGKPAPNLRIDGIADYKTKLRLGAVVPTPRRPRFPQQGVGFNTSAFLNPDPQHSYIEARNEGIAEMLRLALPDTRPKVPIGYSMGADVVTHFLHRWPAERRHEIRKVVTFGSPGRHAGPTLLGNNPPGQGISGVWTPDWAIPITYDFIIDGDWYPCARGLLPFLYEILTRMELSLEFAMYLFSVLTSTLGPALLGIATNVAVPVLGGVVSSVVPGFGALSGIFNMVTGGLGGGLLGGGGGLLPGTDQSIISPLNLFALLPQVIMLLMDALKFIGSNAHGHYHDQPVFNGMTGVDRAAQIIRDEVAEAVVYTVPGTWGGWNDGPGAGVAWALAPLMAA